MRASRGHRCVRRRSPATLRLLQALPPDLEAAICIATHVAAHTPNNLYQFLSLKTRMPVASRGWQSGQHDEISLRRLTAHPADLFLGANEQNFEVLR